MTIFRLWLVLMFGSVTLQAQQASLTLTITDHDTHEPLAGAVALIQSLSVYQTADENGTATLFDMPQGEYLVQISLVGYKTVQQTVIVDTTDIKLEIHLESEHEHIEAVTIQATRTSRTIQKIPTRVEFIAGEELQEKALMNAANITMVLRESTGIQIQQTSTASAANSIRIQGLDGRYTQMLKDGFPLYGGYARGLSLNQIPPLDLKQFEIIKGSSSTLFGGGAIAGLVNLMSKTPEEEAKLDLQLAQTHAGGTTANVFASKQFEKLGYTLYSSGTFQQIYDPENDGYSNIPETYSMTLNPKLFYTITPNQSLWIGLNATYDQRTGGDVKAIKDANVKRLYEIENIYSTRANMQMNYDYKLSEKENIKVKGSISRFESLISTTHSRFEGMQQDVFSEMSYSYKAENLDWVVGINLNQNQFEEKETKNPRDQDFTTLGLFVNDVVDFSSSFSLESGFRLDYLPEWGLFPLPRISALWKISPKLSSRLGGGLGYKVPSMFTEQAALLNYEGIGTIDNQAVDAEYSSGVNLDVDFKTVLFSSVTLSVNQMIYLTNIHRPLILVPQQGQAFAFENADDNLLSRGAETNVKLTYDDFKWFLNYSYNRTTLEFLPNSPQNILTPNHKAGSVLMYENADWLVGVETYYTGVQRLTNGFSPSFITFGLLVQKPWSWGSVYANFENISDVRQSNLRNRSLPPFTNPHKTELFAPTDGFILTVGLIINPFGRESHH